MNNFWQRTLSGAVFVAVIVSACIFHFYQWLFIGILALAMDEWIRITTGAANVRGRVLAVVGACAVYVGLLLNMPFIYAPALFLVFFFSFSLEAFSGNGSLQKIVFQLAGFVYIFVPFALAVWYDEKALETLSGRGEFPFLLFILILIWSNDTFAYLSGKLLGRTSIFASLSPKKTLEGYIGGMLFTMLGAFIFWKCYPLAGPLWYFLVLGAIISFFANAGDLAESFLKRQLGIKDSGRIMPGHGGVLDRFDSFLFVVPAVSTFLYFYASYQG